MARDARVDAASMRDPAVAEPTATPPAMPVMSQVNDSVSVPSRATSAAIA